jgi:hypothetical protein
VDPSDGPVQILATTAVGEGGSGPLAIDPVAPNPTRGPALLGVTLPHAGAVRLSILDVAGREVAVPAEGFQPAGRLEFCWDGRSRGRQAPAGVYVVRLECSGRLLTRKFVIAR